MIFMNKVNPKVTEIMKNVFVPRFSCTNDKGRDSRTLFQSF